MDDRKDGFQTGSAQFDHGDEEVEQGTTSPVDCWELVGSGPSSPVPEARVVRAAFEDAIAAACSVDSVLQHDYFACTSSSSDKEGLPLSTLMADRLNGLEGCSSDKIAALESLDNEAEAGERSTVLSSSLPVATRGDRSEGLVLVHGRIDMHNPQQTSNVENMHFEDSVLHNDMFLQDDSDGVELEQFEMTDRILGVHNIEGRAPTSISQFANESFSQDSGHSDDDSVQSLDSPAIVDSFQLSSMLPAPRVAEQSSFLHDMHDNLDSDQHSVSEEGQLPPVGDVGREPTGNRENPTSMQHSIVSTHNIRNCKLFAYASWLWTHVGRWQAQLGFANTIWSMALAAAVMGLLVLGRGWKRLQAQNQSLRSQLWAKEKRITQLMLQLIQTKDSLVKARRVPVIYVKPASRIPHDHT